MPVYLFTSRYVGLIAQSLLLAFLILIVSYFVHRDIFPYINSAFAYAPSFTNSHIWWTSITAGILSAPKIITAAATFVLIKRWWLKQKEKERLQKEKLLTDLQLLKAQLHPEFLFSSLSDICRLTEQKENPKASAQLLTLADILSYILYECDQKNVLLEKEIKVVKDYLALEKARLGDRLELDVAVKGRPDGLMITPLLLFSFIENSFAHLVGQELEQNWLNLEFQIEDGALVMKLIHGKTGEAGFEAATEKTVSVTQKRLDYFYPGRYELKTMNEPEIMLTSMKIVLNETIKKNETGVYVPQQMTYATV
jgi:sensor histidine kinase YesM